MKHTAAPSATSRTASIRIPRSTALHMSYTVNPVTLTAVSASISTPVWPLTRTVASISTPAPSSDGTRSTEMPLTGSGWHSGISSWVRFAAMIPAMRAVASTSPFGARPSTIIASVSGRITTRPRAVA